MIKFDKGSGLDVLNPGASLNVGSRSYINGFDQNPGYSPNSPGFVEEGAERSRRCSSPRSTTTPPRPPSCRRSTCWARRRTPTLGPGMWGSVGIITGADVVINDATFQYGGGAINTQSFTIDSQSVLAFITGLDVPTFPLHPTVTPTAGTHAYITNNNFYHNFDAAMQIEPDGLLAGDPLTPLESGHPFFRGNVMQGNGIDGLAVVTDRRLRTTTRPPNWNYIGPIEAIDRVIAVDYVNQDVSAVWDSTDLTYVLRGTIVLGPRAGFFGNNKGLPVPEHHHLHHGAQPDRHADDPGRVARDPPRRRRDDPEPRPVGHRQDAERRRRRYDARLADRRRLDGHRVDPARRRCGIRRRRGQRRRSAGPSDPLIDPGAYSEIRILGIPGNQTTGQQRVPVIITSLRDDTVGTTVRGVQMYNILEQRPGLQPVVTSIRRTR